MHLQASLQASNVCLPQPTHPPPPGIIDSYINGTSSHGSLASLDFAHLSETGRPNFGRQSLSAPLPERGPIFQRASASYTDAPSTMQGCHWGGVPSADLLSPANPPSTADVGPVAAHRRPVSTPSIQAVKLNSLSCSGGVLQLAIHHSNSMTHSTGAALSRPGSMDAHSMSRMGRPNSHGPHSSGSAQQLMHWPSHTHRSSSGGSGQQKQKQPHSSSSSTSTLCRAPPSFPGPGPDCGGGRTLVLAPQRSLHGGLQRSLAAMNAGTLHMSMSQQQLYPTRSVHGIIIEAQEDRET